MVTASVFDINAVLAAAGASHRIAFQGEAGGLVAVRVEEFGASDPTPEARRALSDVASGDDLPPRSNAPGAPAGPPDLAEHAKLIQGILARLEALEARLPFPC